MERDHDVGMFESRNLSKEELLVTVYKVGLLALRLPTIADALAHEHVSGSIIYVKSDIDLDYIDHVTVEFVKDLVTSGRRGRTEYMMARWKWLFEQLGMMEPLGEHYDPSKKETHSSTSKNPFNTEEAYIAEVESIRESVETLLSSERRGRVASGAEVSRRIKIVKMSRPTETPNVVECKKNLDKANAALDRFLVREEIRNKMTSVK